MSFKCGMCNEVQANKVKPEFVVLETRPKNYERRMKEKKVLDYGGSGREIVREVRACKVCTERKK